MQKHEARQRLHAKSRVALGGLLAALMLSAAFASSASAAPAWRFNGAALEGTEKDRRRGRKKRPHRVGLHNHLRQLPLRSRNQKRAVEQARATSPSLPLFNCYTNSHLHGGSDRSRIVPLALRTGHDRRQQLHEGQKRQRLDALRRLVLPALGRLGPRHRIGRRLAQQRQPKAPRSARRASRRPAPN